MTSCCLIATAKDLPPFVTVRHLTAEALPLELLRRPVHLSWVKLDGLVINVPPKGETAAGEPVESKPKTRLANFVIDRVDADGTELYVLPKQEGREPMNWELRKLTLRSAGIGQPMRFKAELTNPKPPGMIHTSGRVRTMGRGTNPPRLRSRGTTISITRTSQFLPGFPGRCLRSVTTQES